MNYCQYAQQLLQTYRNPDIKPAKQDKTVKLVIITTRTAHPIYCRENGQTLTCYPAVLPTNIEIALTLGYTADIRIHNQKTTHYKKCANGHATILPTIPTSPTRPGTCLTQPKPCTYTITNQPNCTEKIIKTLP